MHLILPWQLRAQGDPVGEESAECMITADEKEAPGSGRASVFGSPFSGTPIRFDDFVVSMVSPTR